MSRQINKINTSRVSNLSSPAEIRRVANQLNLKNEKRIRFSHAEKLGICLHYRRPGAKMTRSELAEWM